MLGGVTRWLKHGAEPLHSEKACRATRQAQSMIQSLAESAKIQNPKFKIPLPSHHFWVTMRRAKCLVPPMVVMSMAMADVVSVTPVVVVVQGDTTPRSAEIWMA